VGAIETKTNDVPRSTESVCPRIDYLIKVGLRVMAMADFECIDI